MSKYVPAKNKTRKNKNSEDLLNLKQVLSAGKLLWKTSLENMEDKILGFQFEPVSAKPIRPSYKSQKAFRLKDKARLSSNTVVLEFTEAVVRRCFLKWVFWKISQYSQKNTCVGISKRDSYTGVFLWILRIF